MNSALLPGRLAIDPGALYESRMAATVDSAGVQDGYQLGHRAFFFFGDGSLVRRSAARSHQFRRDGADADSEPD